MNSLSAGAKFRKALARTIPCKWSVRSMPIAPCLPKIPGTRLSIYPVLAWQTPLTAYRI